MVEGGALVYIPPSKCSSRDSEIQFEGKVKQKPLIMLEQGSLKAVSSDKLATVDVGAEMKLMYALQRRGLAFDLVDLLSWDVHTEWAIKWFRSLMAEAVPNFHPISLEQLLRADQELLVLLAAECSGSLKPDQGQDPPLDEQVQTLIDERPKNQCASYSLAKIGQVPYSAKHQSDWRKLKSPSSKKSSHRRA